MRIKKTSTPTDIELTYQSAVDMRSRVIEATEHIFGIAFALNVKTLDKLSKYLYKVEDELNEILDELGMED